MRGFSFINKIRNKIKISKENNVSIGKNLKMSNCHIIIKGKNNTLKIDNNCILRSSTIEIVGENCKIEIGKNCMIGKECYLSAKEKNTDLIIEDNCGLSRNIKIMTSDGHPIYQNSKRCNEAESIFINEHVWIADNVTILKGVTIESGSVIGINATVTKNVPANSVAAGNPARVVKTDISWES